MLPTTKNTKTLTVCVLGPPGSHVDHHAEVVAARNGVPFLSYRGVIEHAIQSLSFLGPAAKHYRDQNLPIPPAVSNLILLRRLCELDCHDSGYVLTGFPRTTEDVGFLGMNGRLPSKAIILDLSNDVVQSRTHGMRNDELRHYRTNIEDVKDCLDDQGVKVISIDANPRSLQQPQPQPQPETQPTTSSSTSSTPPDSNVTDHIDTASLEGCNDEEQPIASALDDLSEFDPEVYAPTPGLPPSLLSPNSSREKEQWDKGGGGPMEIQCRLRRVLVQNDVFYLPESYSQIQHLGGGAYGHVIQAFDQNRGEVVAIKKIRNLMTRHRSEENRFAYVNRAFRELLVMMHIGSTCPFVMPLYDVLLPKNLDTFDDLTIVMPLQGRNLASALRHKSISRRTQLHDKTIKEWIYQILIGLLVLHRSNVLHRDIKGENILLSKDPNPHMVLMDYGLARGVDTVLVESSVLDPRSLEEEGECLDRDETEEQRLERLRREQEEEERKREMMSTYMLCTQYYRSPELCLYDATAHPAIDIWSIGCIFGEMLMPIRDRRVLFRGRYYPNDYERSCDDQLKEIFRVLGTPPRPSPTSSLRRRQLLEERAIRQARRARLEQEENEEEEEGEGEEIVEEELVGLKTRIEKVRRRLQFRGAGLRSVIPEIRSDALDLLSKMLEINPKKRITVLEALSHDYFADVREEHPEWNPDELADLGRFGVNYAAIRERHGRGLLDSRMLKKEMFRVVHEWNRKMWGYVGDPQIIEN